MLFLVTISTVLQLASPRRSQLLSNLMKSVSLQDPGRPPRLSVAVVGVPPKRQRGSTAGTCPFRCSTQQSSHGSEGHEAPAVL